MINSRFLSLKTHKGLRYEFLKLNKVAICPMVPFQTAIAWMPCCLSLTGCSQKIQLSAILVVRSRAIYF